MSTTNQSQMLNELGFHLLKVCHAEDNASFSPLAILQNLNFALQASGCEKLMEQINQLLQLNPNEKEKNVKIISDLIKNVVNGEPEFVKINLACGICQAPSIDCAKYSKIENIIFSKGKDCAQNANTEVLKMTENKIKNLLTSAHEPTHGITIFSAMELKAPFCHVFLPDYTESKDFYISSTKSIQVQMMRYGSLIMYNEDKEVGVRMMLHSFNGCNFDIVIMMPIKPFGLAEMEKKLTADKYVQLLKNMRSVLGTIYIPRISLDQNTVLKKNFETLGIKMNNPNGIIDNFVHGVSINLNEFGSNVPRRELNSNELCGPCLGGFMEPPEEQEILADHPFLLAINFSKNNSMVLLSRILHPVPVAEN